MDDDVFLDWDFSFDLSNFFEILRLVGEGALLKTPGNGAMLSQ